MAVYPTSPMYSYPVTLTPVWNTLISDFEKGAEQRRKKWAYAKYNVIVQYTALSTLDAKTIYEFYMARNGSYESFYFYDPYAFDHVGLYVATGDGVTDVFDIPGSSTSARTLYENDVLVSSGFSYLTGGGDGSSDRVDYVTAPPLGTIITIDFTGYLRAKVRFKDDNLSRENFTTTLMRYGLELQGL